MHASKEDDVKKYKQQRVLQKLWTFVIRVQLKIFFLDTETHLQRKINLLLRTTFCQIQLCIYMYINYWYSWNYSIQTILSEHAHDSYPRCHLVNHCAMTFKCNCYQLSLQKLHYSDLHVSVLPAYNRPYIIQCFLHFSSAIFAQIRKNESSLICRICSRRNYYGSDRCAAVSVLRSSGNMKLLPVVDIKSTFMAFGSKCEKIEESKNF